MDVDATVSAVERVFSRFPLERVTLDDMGAVAKVRVSDAGGQG